MDNWIDQAIYNSYQIITGESTIEEIIEHCEIRAEDIEDPLDVSVTPVFFIPPEEEFDNEDIDSMISHFEEIEAYEECAVLLKLKK
jgi:hypothetical protein|tara:strand:+ start:518 stop:775 length:258 start_codon:yes stop_codon:yes gene_type:complete